MKKILFPLAFGWMSILQINAGDVTATQVNGTWKYRDNEFKVLAIGQQQLQIEFSGVYEYKTGDGERTANTGEGTGVAKIEGDTAIFKPEGAEDECKITLKFGDGKLVVTQTGICGFGFNVRADGTYKKVSSKKPKFAVRRARGLPLCGNLIAGTFCRTSRSVTLRREVVSFLRIDLGKPATRLW